MTEGILLIDKPKGRPSFFLVRCLRRLSGERKVGHAGTLDPFATGVMVMLIGRKYTQLSNQYLEQDKEYVGRLRLGIETDTFDLEGKEVARNDRVPTAREIADVLSQFQGNIEQVPPMYSAKKVKGQKLYELARRGESIERKPKEVHVAIEQLSYTYPYLDLRVACSKGTYVRSLAYDIGARLGCGAHLTELCRSRSGQFSLHQCVSGELLESKEFDLHAHLIT